MSVKIDIILNKLSKSAFRSGFHIDDEDKEYIHKKGIDVIRQHAYDFVNKNLKHRPVNDGKQTPTFGHPVFVAQHATATCCRQCLYKWHHIDENKDLTQDQIDYIVDVIMAFIVNDIAEK